MRLKLGGTPCTSAGLSGTVYDAEQFVAERLHKGEHDTVDLFHRTKHEWAAPGARAPIATNVSDPRSVQQFGDGFYVSTRPEVPYGKYQLDLSRPVTAFHGKKVFEVEMSYDDVPGTAKVPPGFKMPDGADLIAVDPGVPGDVTWFVYVVQVLDGGRRNRPQGARWHQSTRLPGTRITSPVRGLRPS